jgi:integral membrane protein (TIGR01906 family)
VKTSPAQTIASVLVALSTPCVVVAAAVVLFLNPVWVGFDQERSDVSALTGFTPTEVRQVTGSILSDLVFGPPSFDVAVNGQSVLDARERSHMADVRNVLIDLGLVALAATVVLIAAGMLSRGQAWFWQAVRAGSRLTLAGVVVVGLGFAIFFEQAFLLFHEIFFSAGSYEFDPTKEKLVQLFPDQFWSETSVAIALAVLALTVVALVGSDRLLARSLRVESASGGAPEGLRDAEARP